MMYVLFGMNGLVQVAATLWNDGLHGSMRQAIIQPPESLRVYLAYGVVALILIRVLSNTFRPRSALIQAQMVKTCKENPHSPSWRAPTHP